MVKDISINFTLNQINLKVPNFDWILFTAPYLRLKNNMSAREKITLHYISIIYYSLADLILKIITNYFPNANIFSMMFIQSISLLIFSYLDMKNYGYELPKSIQFRKLILIVIRGLSNCGINIFLTLATYHIKYAIIITILFSNNILNSIFSVLYFKEKFQIRYLFGFMLSFLGLYLFAFSNEKTNSSNDMDNTHNLYNNKNITLGLFYAFMCSLSASILTIFSKKLTDVHSCILNYYCGFVGIIFSSPFLFFINYFETSVGYILLNFLNSLLFHMGSTFCIVSFIYNSLIYISSINFSSIILAFIYGLVFFGEILRIKEFIGILCIISYNLYTILCPLENKNEENGSKNNDQSNIDKNSFDKRLIYNDDF